MAALGLMARVRAVREPRRFGVALFVLSCVPALIAVAAMASDLTRRTRYFGSDPIKEGEHFLGEWTLRFLIFTLMVTPIRQLLGWNWTARHRRTLGLFAFAYGLMHWLTYALLDVQLDFKDLVEDIAKRPYILIGTAGLLLLLPLANHKNDGEAGREAVEPAAQPHLSRLRPRPFSLLDGGEGRHRGSAHVRVDLRRSVRLSSVEAVDERLRRILSPTVRWA